MPRKSGSHGQKTSLEDRRRQLKQRLEATRWNAAVESLLLELATVLTHKFKSPMTGLSLAASRLRRSGERAGDDGTLKTLADQIESMTRRLSDDLDRLLDPFVGYSPPVEPVDVSLVVEDAILLAKEAAGRDDLEFALRTGSDVPLAQGDVNFLLRALHDLLLNAGRVAAPPSIIEVATSLAGVGDVEIGVTIRSLPQGHQIETLFRPPETPAGFPILIVPRIIQRIGGCVQSFPEPSNAAHISVLLPRRQNPATACGARCGK